MNLRAIYLRFASLKLTVVLLILALILTFIGTLAQVSLGIEEAVAVYFRSWWISAQIGALRLPVFPGGWTLGWLLLINLLCAQTKHFRPSWKQTGIWMAHGSILILLLGEFVISMVQQEYVMVLDEGQTKEYVETYKTPELAFIRPLGDGTEQVVAIKPAMLKPGAVIDLPDTSFQLRVLESYPHATLHRVAEGSMRQNFRGAGLRFFPHPGPPPTALDSVPDPAAVVEILENEKSLGKYLVSTRLQPQSLAAKDGTAWTVGMRLERLYLPFSLSLKNFIHEQHPGTTIPSRFSSLLELQDPALGNREIEITMNEPLRFAGWTFYQHSFANEDKTTILHAVNNPAQILPYIACVVGAIGLTWQFSMRLGGFMGRRGKTNATPKSKRRADWLIWGAAAVPLILVGANLAQVSQWDGLPIQKFLEQPVLADGRLKPLEGKARAALLMIHGKGTLRDKVANKQLTAGEWLTELFFDFKSAEKRPLFRVENPEVLQALEFQGVQAPAQLTFLELEPKLATMGREAQAASQVKSEQRTRYQRDVLRLFNQTRLFLSMTPAFLPDPGAVVDVVTALPEATALITAGETADSTNRTLQRFKSRLQQAKAWDEAAGFRLIPPELPSSSVEEWTTTGKSIEKIVTHEGMATGLKNVSGMSAAGQTGDAVMFEKFVNDQDAWMAAVHPDLQKKVRSEATFHRADLFGVSMAIYVATLLGVALSWLLKGGDWLRRAAMGLAMGAWILTTIGLVWRMIIEGRPPVTNLYSSAVFVAWSCAALALVMERIYRNGLGIFTAALAGFSGLIVAHHLSLAGDTMEMMRAVLDSNFWLATHVVVITLGYSATFVAGFIAAIALIKGLFGKPILKSEENMVFGAVCFALLLSFVGTVLGGIWADQSWGRFWGWDPKENGALMIVLWNAAILHARIAGVAKRTGIMVMAVFGNAITSWSWFGTNMLGIGLHSYGFTDGAFFWLSAFVVLQVGIMLSGFFMPKTQASDPVPPVAKKPELIA